MINTINPASNGSSRNPIIGAKLKNKTSWIISGTDRKTSRTGAIVSVPVNFVTLRAQPKMTPNTVPKLMDRTEIQSVLSAPSPHCCPVN